jgi:hypothetical protein
VSVAGAAWLSKSTNVTALAAEDFGLVAEVGVSTETVRATESWAKNAGLAELRLVYV